MFNMQVVGECAKYDAIIIYHKNYRAYPMM